MIIIVHYCTKKGGCYECQVGISECILRRRNIYWATSIIHPKRSKELGASNEETAIWTKDPFVSAML